MKWPCPEDELLATCSRLEFTGADRDTVLELSRQNGIDWRHVYSTAVMHGVAPLVYFNLSRTGTGDLGLHNGVLDCFKRRFADNLVRERRLREGLWEILGFFNRRGIDVMLIKGAAMHFFANGQSRYTVSNDVDLLIRAKASELSQELREEISQLAEGYPLEFDYYRHHDIDMNGVLELDFDRIWGDAIPMHSGGRSFYLMSPEDALITACVNACRKRYFILKALCAIDARLNDGAPLRWDELAAKSRAYQVRDIVYAALVVAARFMASPVPEDLAERLGTANARAAVLDLLSRNLSFSSFSSLYSGTEVANRKLGASLLLPYASYRSDQVWRKIRFATSGHA